tara:strand:+ start:1105 stop:2265 length:1161 start_codon:yes stop_codon:yes gene_type:complete
MIDSIKFYKSLKNNNINFFTGVPDSLLKNFLSQFERKKFNEHLSVGNEGIAVALAAGHYLSSREPALVYMQNSGLGNAINPLNSVVNKKIYGIPMILLIGWRGEVISKNKQIHDEPQHLYQGFITLKQLKLIDVPYVVISNKTKNFGQLIKKIKNKSIELKKPVAIIVRKGTFKKIIDKKKTIHLKSLPKRQKIIEKLLDIIPSNYPIVSNTGYTSRELYLLRSKKNENLLKDFLMTGGMGHAVSVSAGVAKNLKKIKVVCIDGDGSLLMHTSGLQNSAILSNFIHILINNGVHDSVGGQKINKSKIDYKKISLGFGYDRYVKIDNIKKMNNSLKNKIKKKGSLFIEILSSPGSSTKLPRPKEKFQDRKKIFTNFIKKNERNKKNN